MQYSAPRDQRYEQPKQLSDWTCAKVNWFYPPYLICNLVLFFSAACRTLDEETLASSAMALNLSMILPTLIRQMKSALIPPTVS